MKKEKYAKPEDDYAEQKYPGAAIDKADDDEVTAKEVKERTDVLDCNPNS